MNDSDYPTLAPDHFYRMGVLQDVSLGDRLHEWAHAWPERIAVVDGDRRLTYGQLDALVDGVAAGLQAHRLAKGDRVVLQLANGIPFLAAFFGIMRAGAVPIMALPGHRATELSGIFEKAQPVAYFMPEEYLGFRYERLVSKLTSEFPCCRLVVCAGQMPGALSLDELVRWDGVPQPVHVSGTDLAFLSLSGGTTGVPKMIPRTHGDYYYNAWCTSRRCRTSCEDRLLCALPMAHNFSLGSYGIFGALMHGACLVICPYPSADEILPLVQQEGVTTLQLVPSLVQMCVELLSWDDYDLSSLRLLIVGGSVFDPVLARAAAQALGCTLVQVFGVAEGLNCMTSPDDPPDVWLTCQGTPVSEYDQVRVVDESLADVPAGAEGELVTRGPYTIRSYYRVSDQVARDSFTPSGFYRTGDRVFFDAGGNLHVVGRIKEQINKGGEKIMPAEIEEDICRMPDVDQAAVVGLPDKELGSRIWAFVVGQCDDLELSVVRAHLRFLGLADYKMPDELRLVDSLPLTNVGKVNKKALEAMALGEED